MIKEVSGSFFTIIKSNSFSQKNFFHTFLSFILVVMAKTNFILTLYQILNAFYTKIIKKKNAQTNMCIHIIENKCTSFAYKLSKISILVLSTLYPPSHT